MSPTTCRFSYIFGHVFAYEQVWFLRFGLEYLLGLDDRHESVMLCFQVSIGEVCTYHIRICIHKEFHGFLVSAPTSLLIPPSSCFEWGFMPLLTVRI